MLSSFHDKIVFLDIALEHIFLSREVFPTNECVVDIFGLKIAKFLSHLCAQVAVEGIFTHEGFDK